MEQLLLPSLSPADIFPGLALRPSRHPGDWLVCRDGSQTELAVCLYGKPTRSRRGYGLALQLYRRESGDTLGHWLIDIEFDGAGAHRYAAESQVYYTEDSPRYQEVSGIMRELAESCELYRVSLSLASSC